MSPDPTAVKLRLAPDIRVTCRSSGEFWIQLGSLRITGGRQSLAILAAFGTPCTLLDALNTIKSQLIETHDWADVIAQLLSMQRAGMLIDGAPMMPGIAGNDRQLASRVRHRLFRVGPSGSVCSRHIPGIADDGVARVRPASCKGCV